MKREVIMIVCRKKGWNTDSFHEWRMVASIYEMSSKTLVNCWSDIMSQSKHTDRREYEGLFWLVRETLTDHGLLNRRACMYNMDKSGMPLDVKQLKWVAKKGMKKVHGQSSGDKSLIACGNEGTVLLPVLIFKGQGAIESWMDGWWSPEYTERDVWEWLDRSRTFLLLYSTYYPPMMYYPPPPFFGQKLCGRVFIYILSAHPLPRDCSLYWKRQQGSDKFFTTM